MEGGGAVGVDWFGVCAVEGGGGLGFRFAGGGFGGAGEGVRGDGLVGGGGAGLLVLGLW